MISPTYHPTQSSLKEVTQSSFGRSRRSEIQRLMTALKECTRLKDLRRGMEVHSQLDAAGLSSHIYMVTSLINMYAKCGRMVEARRVFDGSIVVSGDVVAWTALMTGYARNGETRLVLELFKNMRKGCVPDARTYVVAISACAALAEESAAESETASQRWLDCGRAIHCQAVTGKCCDIFVESKLVDMYAKCRCMASAKRVFDGMARRNVVSWSALLQGYVDNGMSEAALEVFRNMTHECPPNDRTYVAALSACAALAAQRRHLPQTGKCGDCFESGKEIHAQAVANRCSNIFVENTAVDMYGKCGRMEVARKVFDGMMRRSVVSWNALIMGYLDNGENERALEMFSCMNVERDSTTYVAGLMACGNLMALAKGRSLHEEIHGRGLDKEVVVANCLVDFYGKCGSLGAAKEVFDSIARKTIVSWTALMCGYSLRGDAESVFDLFREMREQGMPPNEVTFLCVLSACSHAGLTDKGREYFDAMGSEYGLSPNIKHFTCMVDILGRANRLDEAVRVLRNMPLEPNGVIWFALLGACRKWNNLEIGRLAYESLMRLETEDDSSSAAHVLMANIYKSAGAREDCRIGASDFEAVGNTWWTDGLGDVHKF